MKVTPFDVAIAALPTGITQLEASAGTGKTFTLAGLFLRLVAEHDVPVGKILVTTFTKAATAELRERIRRLLREAVEMFDAPPEHALLKQLHAGYVADAEKVLPRLRRALQHFDDATISTIHGFCLRLLQDRAFESGLPFDCEALEDESALRREVAEDFWRQHIYRASERLGAFALLAGLSAAPLTKLLGTVVAHPEARILPAHAPTSLAAAETALLAAFTAVEQAWQVGESDIRTLLDRGEDWGIGEMKKPEIRADKLAGLARCLADPSACGADYACLDFFTNAKIETMTSKPRGKPKQPPQHAFFDACTALAEARLAWELAFRREFLDWAPAELARRKQQANVLSFDDLLGRLRDALRGPGGPALLAAAREQFHAALVDEFQDTDPVQAEIFLTIFGGDARLYLIGDPKQAIYGFRGADVFSYLDAVRHAQRRHDLVANQRSVTPLVQAVNAIFGRNPAAFVVPGIDFHPATPAGRHDAAALTSAGQPEPAFRVWIWSEEKPVSKGAARARLTGVVADAIVEQLQNGATTEGRALRASDFAVLTISNDEADQIHDALMAAGLPAVVLSRANVFASAEAGEMLTLLRALAEPTYEPAVRAALATLALGRSAAELAALDEVESERLLEAFLRWHTRWRDEGFFAAFRSLVVAEGVRPRLLAMPDGERRLTNLLHLADLLHRAATAQRLGPAALVRWLATQMGEGAESGEESELRLESDADAVKVVTVHKSKGLEFGIVWCPFSWNGAELRGDGPVSFHDPATNALTLDLGSADFEAHSGLAERERLAEQARLLYVALTRAKLQCHFVSGRFNQCENSAAMWVLHPPADQTDPVGSLKDRALDDASLRQDLALLAAQVPGAFALDDVPEPRGLRFRLPAPAQPPRDARTFHGTIRRDFAITSFSALIAHAPEEAPDHDADTAPAAPAVPVTGIHAFPRGRRAGTCLHEIFEVLDFTADGEVEPVVRARLETSAFDRPDYRSAVVENVRAVLDVELETGLRLAAVPKTKRLNELEFHLPVGRLDPASLERLLGERLSFAELTGFLKGFIDLVFEHDGRFFIVDWKSNWLGATADEYTDAAMDAEMRRHHYGLQFHLYVVALHRYLRQRRAGYDYDRDFGGVFYIFLRGVDPQRPELGVVRRRPERALIEALDALLSSR